MKSFDATTRVPYLTRAASPGFTTYECSLAKSLKLGGAIVWHLAGDVMPDGSHPLLDAAQRCR